MFGVNTIVPRGLQLPPRPFGASHSSSIVPLATLTVFSLPPAKNATLLPSGAQNGYDAPSVPGMLRT
jgi:hypothetical protein